MPVVGPRFLIEAGFIIAVALIAGLQRLGTLWIVAVMAAAWLIVAVVEITVSRRRVKERATQRPDAWEPIPEADAEPIVIRRDPAPRTEPAPSPVPAAETQETKPVAVPRIVAVPTPPPEPEPEPVAVAETEPEPARVVAFTPANDGPREWNLWELERAAREHATGDIARDEERSYLLMYLREFAGPDGVLPVDFDGLVRDAFGDMLHSVAR